jgi:hypothetical protein
MSSSDSWSWSNPDVASEPTPGGPSRRLIGLTALATVLVAGVFLVLSVIGGDGGPTNPIAQAAEQTATYPGFRMELTGSYSGAMLATPVGMRGHGSFNGDDNTGRMTLSAEFPPPAGEVRVDEVMDGGDVYLSSPKFAGQLPPGKQWMKISLLGAQDQSTAAYGQSDPHAQLQMLESASDAFQMLGHEKVNGVRTTHYRATIDLSKRIAQLRSDGNGEAADALEQSASASGTTMLPIEVWIDGRDLIRQVQLSVPLPVPGGQPMTMTMEMSFSDFGTTPQVTVPPPDSVFDATSLVQQTLDASGN